MKIKILMPAMAAIVIAGCSTKEQTGKVEKVINVTASEVLSQSATAHMKYSGTVEAYQTIPLRFETTGTIEKVLVEAGDQVKIGQLLATVDKTDAQSMYDMAKSKQQQAQDGYDRLKSVYEKGSLSEVKWVEMQTNLEQANSSLKIAENNLKKCEMKAPVAGFVGKRNIEPGMSALMIDNSPIEIVEINKVYIKIAIPEKEIGKLKKGDEAEFSVAALDNKVFSGKIATISLVADRLSRTYDAKILVDNKNFDLKPGMICDVNINYSDNVKRLLVPYICVTKDNDNQQFVYVINQTTKRVSKRIITTGQYFDKNIEVLTGLDAGELVVRNGKEKLLENSLINL